MTTTVLAAFWCAVFLLLSAFFSASETALFSIPRERIAFYRNSSRRRHRWVFSLLRDGQRTLLLILLGNVFVNITIVGLVHTLISSRIEHNSPLVTLVSATVIILIFGEILPKNIALRFNERIAVAAAPFLYHMQLAAGPVLTVMQRMNTFFLNRFRSQLQKPSPYVTMRELQAGIADLEQSGALSSKEQRAIAQILDTGSAPVGRLTRHRSQILSAEQSEPVGAVVEQLRARANTYCVVRKAEGNDEIVGLAYLSDLLACDGERTVGDVAVAAEWVPDTLSTAELIGDMLDEGHSEVCVLDEFGAFEGVFSIGEGLERMVASGLSARPRAVALPDGQGREFDALEDPNAVLEWIPPSLRAAALQARTINGLITKHLGKIPKSGETFAIDEWTFYIIKARANRIESVLVKKKE